MVSEIKTDTVLIEFNFFKKETFTAKLSDEHGTINVQINYTANDFQTLATYDSFVSQIRDKWREFLKLKEQQQKQTEKEQANTGDAAAAVETVVSRKRVYDYNDSNDEQLSADVVVVAAAETSNATNATVELESTRRMSLRTKKAANYSEMDEEAASSPSTSDEAASSSSMSEEETNSPSMSETEAESSPATTSKSTKQTKKVYK
jgi:hypothetical protein